MDKEIMKGIVDIIILSLVSKKDMYGYEMVKTLKEISNDLYNMSEGTLYPALKRLEHKNWLQSYWDRSEPGVGRKYYRITDQGKKVLKKKLEEWDRINHFIKVCAEGIT